MLRMPFLVLLAALALAGAARADSGHDAHTDAPVPFDVEQGHGEHGDAPAAPAPADDHAEHGGEPAGAAPDRPRALVLGGFAGLNGAILLGAAIVRRRQGGRA